MDDFEDKRLCDDMIVTRADETVSVPSSGFLQKAFTGLAIADRLVLLRRYVSGRFVFTTSFGLEDQALTHGIVAAGIDCTFVTLDTGRLFPETHAVWAATEERYGIRVRPFHPRPEPLATMIDDYGINGFYHATDARHACCGVRKLEPLGRALAGAAAWLTGLRADQSPNRQGFDFVAYDSGRRLLKVNPLLDWSREQVSAFVAAENVPVNALHAQGFLSIGCAPCTRAVAPGEPERAGRWWWEQDQARECGLHVGTDGRPVRARKPI